MSATTWYIAASGGNDSNPGTYDDPLATFAQAVTNARPGDTIHFLEGIFNLSVVLDSTSKNGITIEGEGEGQTLIIVAASGTSLRVGSATTIRRLKLQTVHVTGQEAVIMGESCIVEDAHIMGRTDAVKAGASAILRRSRFMAGFDVVQVQDRHLIEECEFVNDGSVASAGQTMAALSVVGDVGPGEIRNSTVKVTRSSATNFPTYGIAGVVGNSGDLSSCLLDNVDVEVNSTNAEATEDAIAIFCGSAQGGILNLRGVRCVTSNAGSGDDFHVRYNNAAGHVSLAGCSIDSAKLDGAATFVDSDKLLIDILAEVS